MSKRTCDVVECERSHYAAGYCNPHWRRWRRNGEPGPAKIGKRDAGTCTFDGCGRDKSAKDLCGSHYAQHNRGTPLTPLNDRVDPRGRDEHGNKRCSTCKLWLSVASFKVVRKRPDGLNHRCTACSRDRLVMARYGISGARYDELLAVQRGGCAICGGVNESGRLLAVDHDHACCPGDKACGGCVRGLLCSNCNMAIGLLRDDVDRFEAAITYLKR